MTPTTKTEIAAVRAELDLLRQHLATARDGKAVTLATLAMLHQHAAAFTDDMDGAGEPEPIDTRPVMPAHALRRQRAPGGLWEPDAPG